MLDGRYLKPRFLRIILVMVLAAAQSSYVLAASEIPPGLREADPVICSGHNTVVLRSRFIETSGMAVVANGHCDVEIVDSHIVAGGVGIMAQGYGNVKITNSYVEGGRAAMIANGRGKIVFHNTTVRGATLKNGRGEIVGDGQPSQGTSGVRESLEDAAAALESIHIGRGGIEVRDSENSVSIGGDGLIVDNGTDTVSVTADRDGVRLDTGVVVLILDGDVSIDDDNNLRLSLRSSVEIAEDWRTAERSPYRGADTDRLLHELGAKEEHGEQHIVLGGDVLFDVDSITIRPAGAEALRKVAHIMRQRSVGEIRLVGHTDSLGGDEHNLKLSQARAAAVMRWLHREEGIPAQLMVGQGVGPTKPIAYNTMPDGSDHPEGRAKNRRVEIYFTARN